MEIAFTTLSKETTSHEVICLIDHPTGPRKDESVEIDDKFYVVDSVEWHITTDAGATDADGYTIGDVVEKIVRLTKVGEA